MVKTQTGKTLTERVTTMSQGGCSMFRSQGQWPSWQKSAVNTTWLSVCPRGKTNVERNKEKTAEEGNVEVGCDRSREGKTRRWRRTRRCDGAEAKVIVMQISANISSHGGHFPLTSGQEAATCKTNV